MGSFVELNDTLQITSEQGFPVELDINKHIQNPISVDDLKDRVFEFKDKKGIRNYHQPPVRNFLVENKDGKWRYWGLIHILEVKHDYSKQLTSGKFKIVKIYSPAEMDIAHDLVDGNDKTKP